MRPEPTLLNGQLPAPRRRGALGWLLLSVCLLAPPSSLQAQDSDPFAIRSHALEGVVLQVWPLSISDCPGGETDLLVLTALGGPPTVEKRATWMPCGSALRPGDPSIVRRPLPHDAVLVDVARVPGRVGPQLLTISAGGIRVESLLGDEPPGHHAIPGGLPLAPNPWQIARVEVVADWHGTGGTSAFVPALDGGWVVDLVSGEARKIVMPIYSEYRTWMPHLPAMVWKWMLQEITWPTIVRADDNGDGRPDLFALSRWQIAIFHSGPEGLPSHPSRTLELIPFDEEMERRHGSTVNNYFAHDIDGDGRADLMLSTVGGGMMDGRSLTRIFLNTGSGVSTDGTPAAEREVTNGFSGLIFEDLDGDGASEMIETSFEFGLVQLMRILVTRRAETKIRVLVLDPEQPDGLRALFEDDFAFKLDFGESTFVGVVPSLGDWNGDGVRDLYVPRGEGAIGFRLGSKKPGEELFGSLTGEQPLPLFSGESRVADLNGDGLDEIVAFSNRTPEEPLIVLENLGRLPGTRAELRARDSE